ncbi:hypothetical protein DND132_2724 [Pseudodesulfovibrio mercurii]|uniref:Uncharacterized protein n=1 Tax=Pseudodesulfovibrio mercurii TaxID=641491 RepID=F0JJ28_9BACT|nr:hypothetical protein [Pseudodesulfovibrio mercurii]EGB15927.1 hypothetical protein DND132_2724 [Pseudodesulfovibrio mercurii]
MSHGNPRSKHLRLGLAAALLCLFLPALAFAYGGGGDVGKSTTGGPTGQDLPDWIDSTPYETGIEGEYVEPAPGTWGGYYTPEGRPTQKPGKNDTPWYNTPEYEFVEKLVIDQTQDKIIEMVLASNPQLLATVKALQAANGVYEFTRDAKDKLDKSKKDYQKALIGNMGSNLKGPDSEIPEMSSYTPGGGGPAPLNESIFMQ